MSNGRVRSTLRHLWGCCRRCCIEIAGERQRICRSPAASATVKDFSKEQAPCSHSALKPRRRCASHQHSSTSTIHARNVLVGESHAHEPCFGDRQRLFKRASSLPSRCSQTTSTVRKSPALIDHIARNVLVGESHACEPLWLLFSLLLSLPRPSRCIYIYIIYRYVRLAGSTRPQ